MPALRASDADRDRTVAALRHHAAAGRLTIEELDARSERAYAAQTLDELAELQTDLPAIATQPVRRRHATLAPGWRGFTSRWESPVSAPMAMAELVADLAPAIQEHGFELIQRADDRLRFETRRRPVWTWIVVVLVPVFGWFAVTQGDRADHGRRRRDRERYPDRRQRRGAAGDPRGVGRAGRLTA